MRKSRNILEKKYHQLYNKFSLLDENRCTYCGMQKECLDHVPPLDWLAALGSDWFYINNYPLILVPSCTECNSWLGNLKKFDILTRADYVEKRIIKTYRKFLILEEWGDDELAEMGKGFQEILKYQEALRITTERRLAFVRCVKELLKSSKECKV